MIFLIHPYVYFSISKIFIGNKRNETLSEIKRYFYIQLRAIDRSVALILCMSNTIAYFLVFSYFPKDNIEYLIVNKSALELIIVNWVSFMRI